MSVHTHTHTVSCCFSLHCWRHMGVRMHVCTGVLATREITNRCATVSGSGFEFGLWMCLSYLSFLCLFRWFGVIFHIHHIVGSLTHGALTPLPQSRPSVRGRPQCSVSCPPTPTPLGALAFPQLAPLSTTATWPNQVSQENKEQIDRKKTKWDYEKQKTRREENILFLSYSTPVYFIHVYCTPNYAWKEEHCLFWQLLMFACHHDWTHTYPRTCAHSKDEGTEHTVATCQGFHWNATLLYNSSQWDVVIWYFLSLIHPIFSFPNQDFLSFRLLTLFFLHLTPFFHRHPLPLPFIPVHPCIQVSLDPLSFFFFSPFVSYCGYTQSKQKSIRSRVA